MLCIFKTLFPISCKSILCRLLPQELNKAEVQSQDRQQETFPFLRQSFAQSPATPTGFALDQNFTFVLSTHPAEKSGPSRAHPHKGYSGVSAPAGISHISSNWNNSVSSTSQESSAKKRQRFLLVQELTGGFWSRRFSSVCCEAPVSRCFAGHGREGEMPFLSMRIITLNYLTFISNLTQYQFSFPHLFPHKIPQTFLCT